MFLFEYGYKLPTKTPESGESEVFRVNGGTFDQLEHAIGYVTLFLADKAESVTFDGLKMLRSLNNEQAMEITLGGVRDKENESGEEYVFAKLSYVQHNPLIVGGEDD